MSYKFKAFSNVWVVIISIGATLVVVGAGLINWYLSDRVSKLESKSIGSSQVTITATKTASTAAKVASESPPQAAENFMKSIFDTFSGSSVDLSKAKKYLSAALQAKVNDKKESYWDLHGYIHSGPCSASFKEISKTETIATVEVSTEWGEKCYVGVEEAYYRYKMSLADGKWTITEIEQLKPPAEGEEIVPRDF